MAVAPGVEVDSGPPAPRGRALAWATGWHRLHKIATGRPAPALP